MVKVLIAALLLSLVGCGEKRPCAHEIATITYYPDHWMCCGRITRDQWNHDIIAKAHEDIGKCPDIPEWKKKYLEPRCYDPLVYIQCFHKGPCRDHQLIVSGNTMNDYRPVPIH